MILCVCLNPAVDTTYVVPGLTYGTSHRVEVAGRRAGGKGLNVARVLHQLGEQVLVTGFAGGADGAAVLADLARSGIDAELTEIEGQTRRTVTVYDRRDATVFNEQGPPVRDDEWQGFLALYRRLLAGASVVVVAGSQPPRVPVDAYAQLTATARTADVPVLLDAPGAELRAALSSRPDVVKPNRLELAELVGTRLESLEDVLAAGRTLVAQGAGAVVVSLGVDGLVAVTPAGEFRVQVPAPVSGNPTGAGDALAAAVARGMRRGDDWPDRLSAGVAVSVASVTVELAGATDEALAAALLPSISVEALR